MRFSFALIIAALPHFISALPTPPRAVLEERGVGEFVNGIASNIGNAVGKVEDGISNTAGNIADHLTTDAGARENIKNGIVFGTNLAAGAGIVAAGAIGGTALLGGLATEGAIA